MTSITSTIKNNDTTKLAKKYANNSSILAISKATTAFITVLRWMWTLVLLACLGGLCWHSWLLVGRYMAYPHQVTITLKTAKKLIFPAVTVCNLNPIRKSYIECMEKYEQLALFDHGATAASMMFANQMYPDSNLDMESIDGLSCHRLVERYRNKLAYGGAQPLAADIGIVPKEYEVHGNYTRKDVYQGDEYAEQQTASLNGADDDHKVMRRVIRRYDQLVSKQTTGYETLLEAASTFDLTDIRQFLYIDNEIMDSIKTEAAERLILECSFDKANCGYEFFKTSYNKQYGLCHSFNFVDRLSSVIKTTKWGTTHGLKLTLDIEAEEYVGLLAPTYGVRVVIHDPYVSPVPEKEGINAGPGQLTMVPLVYGDITRLEEPFESNCTNDYIGEWISLGLVMANTSYSVSMCRLVCQNAFILNRCGCIDNLQTDAELRQCDFFNAKDRRCLDRSYAEFANHTCDCSSPCFERRFSYSVSHSAYPTKQFEKVTVNTFLGSDRPLAKLIAETEAAGQGNFREYSRENLVRLHIYYEGQTYESINEEEAYPLSQLFADLGGILGLYLGVSIAHLFEIAEFFIEACYRGAGCTRRRKRGKQESDATGNEGAADMIPPPETGFDSGAHPYYVQYEHVNPAGDVGTPTIDRA